MSYKKSCVNFDAFSRHNGTFFPLKIEELKNESDKKTDSELLKNSI